MPDWPKVLAVHVAGLQQKPQLGQVIGDKLRFYDHFTDHHNHDYVCGSITLFIIKKENETGQDSQNKACAAALCTGRPEVQSPLLNKEGSYWSVQPTTSELTERLINFNYHHKQEATEPLMEIKKWKQFFSSRQNDSSTQIK